MKPLEFLFYIISHFISLEPGRLSTLKDEAAKWEREQLEKDNLLSKTLKHGNAWYVQVALALSLIFVVKAISNWLVSAPEIDPESPEDETPIFNAKTKKFIINN